MPPPLLPPPTQQQQLLLLLLLQQLQLLLVVVLLLLALLLAARLQAEEGVGEEVETLRGKVGATPSDVAAPPASGHRRRPLRPARRNNNGVWQYV
jgi:hypothetical protein